jgi:hypothetical protein
MQTEQFRPACARHPSRPPRRPRSPAEETLPRARLLTRIGSYLEKYGEFLPLRCDEGNYWLFHVTHFVDALDENASHVLRSSDHPNVVLMIHRHIFQPANLTADWMFKLPQSRGRGEIYVTDPFVDLIRTSGLTGLEFKRVWPHS